MLCQHYLVCSPLCRQVLYIMLFSSVHAKNVHKAEIYSKTLLSHKFLKLESTSTVSNPICNSVEDNKYNTFTVRRCIGPLFKLPTDVLVSFSSKLNFELSNARSYKRVYNVSSESLPCLQMHPRGWEVGFLRVSWGEGECDTVLIPRWGGRALPIIDYMGRLRPKGVPSVSG